MYSLTRAGELFLNSWVAAMNAFQDVITQTTEGLRSSEEEPPS